MVLYNQNKRKFWCSEKTADGVSFLLSNFIRNCRWQLLMEKIISKETRQMKELTVKFLLDEDMLEELEELQRGFHEWKNKDGEYPFKDFSLEKTFNAVMISGSKTYVREKINYAKFQIGLIDRDTYIKKVSEILTPEEKSPVPPAQMEKAHRPRKPEHKGPKL